ncbi:uncharacterized protein LOC124928039 [Impatiens glandulifera]|uniref:uncharacterized protein LOC124928039 n=1 Tax=Impatiens glandulifera TaxID=253017 RepID=UPI001FB0E0B0|nr:uncharacterized protein LOC124928039 [Impatiens glandulifera]
MTSFRGAVRRSVQSSTIRLTGIIAIAHLLHHGFTEATTTFMNLSEPKGTSGNGDIIDCVNIYKQISFDNPLIKSSQLNLNLEKQMKRYNSFPKNKLVQDWHKNGECPFQTVPIIRSLRRHTKTFQQKLSAIKFGDNKNRDHAVVWDKEGAYLGASAKFSVSNPQTQPNDFSLVQIRLLNGMDTRRLNSIQAGWTEYATGDWWLELDNILIGYWPRIIFSHYLNDINSTISKISWGGEVYYEDDSDQHTGTQMGNGLFPGKGPIRASHVRNLRVIMKKKWSSPGWFLSEFLGKETMLALVCKNCEGVKALETYDKEVGRDTMSMLIR